MKYFSMIFQVLFLSLILLEFSYSQEITFHSPDYFSQSKNEYDPLLFLDSENIIFSVCDSEINNIKITHSCSDSKEVKKLTAYSTNDGCYISQVKNIDCENSELKITYKQDEKNVVYSKELIKTKESEVVNFVLEQDFNEIKDPLQLSYYLIVYNKVKGMDETSEEIYEKLRNLRNNDNKCWPKSCNVETTTEILYNLKLAGYELDSRLLEDGLIYLDKAVKSSSSNSGSVKIQFEYDSSNDVTCTLHTDGDLEINETFNESENFSKENFKEHFNLSCTRDVDKIKLIVEDPIRGDFNKTLKDDRDYDYELVDSYCYGKNLCNVKSTLQALIVYGKHLEYSNDLEKYVNELKLNSTTNQKYINSKSNSMYSSMYLETSKNEEIGNFVKFSQNNDGSWGDSSNKENRVEETFWGVLGLENVKNSEGHITDAQNWMYFTEPSNGWEEIKNNALAYLTIEKYIRPFIILDYSQVIKNNTEFKIENPSIFNIENIEIEIDSTIDPYIEYTTNLGDINANSEIAFNVSSKSKILSDKSGMIKIFGIVDDKRTELVKQPIIIKSSDILEFPSEKIFYSKDLPLLKIPIKYSEKYEITCTYKDSINNLENEITLKNSNVEIEIKNTKLHIGNLDLDFNCKSGKDQISFTKNFTVSQSKALFEVMNEADLNIITNFKDSSIIFQSLTSQKQEITLSFENTFFGIINFNETSFTLTPNNKKEITFNVNQEDLLESMSNSSDSIVITSSLGYIQKVPFQFNYEKEASLSFLYIFIIVLAIALIGLIGFRIYELKQNEEDDEFNENDDEFEFDDLDLN